MTEDDWGLIHRRWNDPQVAQYAYAGDNPADYALEQLQDILRTISAKALFSIIEYSGRAIGECWLQEMNLERILKRRPGQDCRQIDIEIGEKDYWGRGIGTEAIRLLVDFGFN